MTTEGVERELQDKIEKQKSVWCPLIKEYCHTDCVALVKELDRDFPDEPLFPEKPEGPTVPNYHTHVYCNAYFIAGPD